TNRFPRLHVIIPLIDILNQHLEDAAKRKTTDYYVHPQTAKSSSTPSSTPQAPIVSLAALKGLAVLDKYYGKTDELIMYRAAMVMHPSYRTSYFDKMDWPDSWKKTAIDLVRNEWVTHYKVVETSSTGTSAAPSRKKKNA
ncbi:hypothetical protein C8F01DRAFT_161349, partial [Mycena amicta]